MTKRLSWKMLKWSHVIVWFIVNMEISIEESDFNHGQKAYNPISQIYRMRINTMSSISLFPAFQGKRSNSNKNSIPSCNLFILEVPSSLHQRQWQWWSGALAGLLWPTVCFIIASSAHFVMKEHTKKLFLSRAYMFNQEAKRQQHLILFSFFGPSYYSISSSYSLSTAWQNLLVS